MPSLPVKLPAYTVAKFRHGGWDFYFQVPERLRPKGWLPTHRLPIPLEDRTRRGDAAEIAAVVRDGKMLYKLLTDTKEGKYSHRDGSIPWLIDQLEKDADEDLGWHQLAHKTQVEYSRYFRHLRGWSEEARKLTGAEPHITELTGPAIRKFLARYKDAPPRARARPGGDQQALRGCDRAR